MQAREEMCKERQRYLEALAVYIEMTAMVEEYQQATPVSNLSGIRDVQGLYPQLGLKNLPQVHEVLEHRMVVAEAAQRLRLPLISKDGEIHEEEIEKLSIVSRSSLDSTSTSITMSSSTNSTNYTNVPVLMNTPFSVDVSEPEVGGVPNRFLGITPSYLWQTQLQRTPLSMACAHHNFGELCLCLAMSYLDRFLSVYNLPGGKTWAIHLAAVTCLSLAAKIDEVNVPNTVNLQAGEPKFLFEGKTIKRMEILVLNYLKWHTKPHTPLNFVEYFLKRMNDDIETPQGPLITRSIQIILSTIKGIDFLEFKPSELAAAVAVFVSSEKRAMDIDKALSSFLIIEKGRVMKCLELIQDLISTCGTTCSSLSTTTTLTTNMANGSILSSSFCCSPNGVLDAACLSYKSDERKVVSSCPCSSETSPDKKRRKLDQKN